MRSTTILLCGLLATLTTTLHGAEPEEAAPKKETAAPSHSDLEKRFQDTLTNAVFDGRWAVLEDGKLGDEHPEKYVIQSVRKMGTDLWMIYAHVQYGQKDLVVPVPVQVKWAEDTPVIMVTKMELPGLGTYTARVLVYEDKYAGTWSASDHGGLLHGVITHPKKSE